MNGWNLVDSSGWLEFLTGSERADLFAAAITDTANLIVPVISVYEVVKRTLRDGNEADAVNAISAMVLGRLINLDLSLALEAAHYRLPLADSIIYATAQRYAATLWTQDQHFEDLPGVRYFAK